MKVCSWDLRPTHGCEVNTVPVPSVTTWVVTLLRQFFLMSPPPSFPDKRLLSVSMYLPVLDSSYKWNHILTSTLSPLA